MEENFVSCEILPVFQDENTIDILMNIVECMFCGIVVAKIEGEFLIWNSQAALVLGKKEENIPHEKWSELYGCYNPETEELLHYSELPLYKAMNGEIVKNYVMLIKNKTTDKSWIDCNAKPLYKDGKIIGGVIVFINITDKKIAEEKTIALLENIKILTEKQELLINKLS